MSTFVKTGSKVLFTDDAGNTHSLSAALNVVPDPKVDYRAFITARTRMTENEKPGDLFFSIKSVTIPAPPLEGWTRNALISELNTNFFFSVNTDFQDIIFKVAYYEEIESISGRITPPEGTTIILDGFGNGVDAVISAIPNGTGSQPDYQTTGVEVISSN